MSDTIIRQIQMLRFLERTVKKSASDIHQHLLDEGYSINKRTVERDLQKLSEIFPIDIDEREKPFGWSWSKVGKLFDLPSLDHRSALTFKMIEKYMAHLLPYEVLTDIQPYFDLAENVLNTNKENKLSSWEDKIEVDKNSYPLVPPVINEDTLHLIYEALYKGQQISARNTQADGTYKDYSVINPLGLIFQNNILYLACTFYDYEDKRLLAVHRLSDVELLYADTVVPDDFNLSDYVKKEQVTSIPYSDEPNIQLKVRFYEEAGYHLMETKLSEEQTVEKYDGYLEISAVVKNTARLRWWLLGFGDLVEVLEPKSLRDEFIEVTKNMNERYLG